MITLEKEFVANYDKSGNNKFTLVKRNAKAAIYKRQKMDGRLVGFEVFKITIQPKGTKFPGGVITLEDKERYPTSNSFGKWAWFTVTENMANTMFDRISVNPDIIGDYDPETDYPVRPENEPSLEEVLAQPDETPSPSVTVKEQPVQPNPVGVPQPTVQPKKRGRPAKNTKPIDYKYPEGEFDRVTFAKFNGLPFDPVEPTSYIGIKKLIEDGLIAKVREQYTGSRPKSIYAAVKQA